MTEDHGQEKMILRLADGLEFEVGKGTGNVQFRNDGVVEGHIGEAVGFYEADKGIVHLYAPSVGHHNVPAANVDEAEKIFWDFVNEVDDPISESPSNVH